MNSAEPQRGGENPSDQGEFQQLREVIDSIPAIAWTSLPDNSKAIANSRWAEYTGLPKDDPSTWHSVVHPDDREAAQARWQQSLTTGEPMESEARYRCAATGEYRWFLCRAEAVRDEKGNIVRWYGILTDIEDRKRMEQSLRRSEAYLEEAQRLTHTGSWAYRPAVDLAIHGSKEMFRILGLDPELRLPDMSEFLDIIHPEDRATVTECLERAFRDKTDFAYESRILLRDGTAKHIHVIGHAVIGEDGEFEYIGTIADSTERNRAEQERTQQALLLNQTHDAIFLRNLGGLIQYWNRGAQELYGWSAGEAVGRDVKELLKTIFPSPLEEIEAELMRTGRWDGELVHTTRDGGRVFVASRWSLQRDSGGTPIAILHINNDMTERKRAEERLRSTVAELQRVMDSISDCLWSGEVDEHGTWTYRYYSPAVERITGRPPSFYMQGPNRWAETVHEDDRPRLMQAFQRVATGQSKHEEEEYRIVCPDGEVRWVRDSAKVSRLGNLLRIDGVVSDITARKRAEEELRASESRFRVFVDHATDAFFLHNEQLAIVDVNRQACKSLGYSREDLIGMQPHDYDAGLDQAQIARLAERISAGETVSFESLHRRKDGTVFPVEARVRPFLQGDRRFFLGCARDITDRKRAEEELREAETRFRTFVDHGSDLFLVHDYWQATILDANQEAWQSLGYTREEIIGMHPSDFDRGPVTPTSTAVMRERLEAGETIAFESVLLRKDGSKFPVEWKIRRYQQGENWFALSSARDITERKRAEEGLRQAETRFRTFVDHATDAFFVIDVDTGAILDVNRRACENLGYTREELIGKTLPLFDVDLTLDWIGKNLRPRLEAGESVTFETHHRRKDGSVFPVEIRSRRYEYGGKVVTLSLALDITERKRAEQELRQAETRFRVFVDQATDAFFVMDVESRSILDVNRRACESLGYTREEIIGKTIWDFDVGIDREWFEENIRPRLAAGESVSFETRERRKDGTVFPVEARARWFEYGGRLVSLGLAVDITERKRAEEERERLRQLEADLAHINRVSLMGELAASIAHEINQPLSGVVTNGSACIAWLTGDSPNLEEAREAALRIVRDGKRAGEVIARIRSLATSAAIPKERLDLNETIRDVLALLVSETKKNGITIGTQLADDLSPVMGDRVQLQQVVLNLVMNAIEATSRTKESTRDLIIRTSNTSADEVRVEVQDSGVGFEADKIGKLFAPFYSTKPGGMGMGLSISRSIIRSHGGQMSATPNTGPGATFYFTLPKLRPVETEAG